ncbi:MAG: hypothetical protein ACE37J_02305 [Pikeienuella sp.]|uniref:hypothetical protein n=1 Tax=Pikeienuella sp. TaxID=2831957 RepID=UPI0039192BE2
MIIRLDDVLISSYQTGGSAESADRFDFKIDEGGGTQIGLLLPAVQKVREAAAVEEPIDDFAIPEDDGAVQIGLLLPAVQKVREAAAVEEPDMDFTAGRDDGETEGSIPIFPEYDDYAHKKYPPSSSSTAADDVIVDGNIITAENYDSMF